MNIKSLFSILLLSTSSVIVCSSKLYKEQNMPIYEVTFTKLHMYSIEEDLEFVDSKIEDCKKLGLLDLQGQVLRIQTDRSNEDCKIRFVIGRYKNGTEEMLAIDTEDNLKFLKEIIDHFNDQPGTRFLQELRKRTPEGIISIIDKVIK